MSNKSADIKVRAYHFSISIIKFLEILPNKRLYWTISDQLLRSATSIGVNIIEAKSSSSKREFKRFYEIALKSANETKYWLGLLRDATDADKNIVNELLAEAKEISNILAASVLTMKNKKRL